MELMKKDNMRTITKKLSLRLKAQAKEADLVGLKKLAGHLGRLSKTKTRPTEESYVYAEEEGPIWEAVLRIADYYDCNVNPELIQNNIEKLSKDLVIAVSKQAGIKHGVGVFEPTVPGEEVIEQVLIEVD